MVQLKSVLISLFNGEEIKEINLKGLEHVISVSLGPRPATDEELPKVHIRVFTTRLLASGSRIPRVELMEMGPSLDLVLRRHTEADEVLLKEALKRRKLAQTDVEKGLGRKRKNIDTDAMGDTIGRLHIGNQDLHQLKRRKLKSLRNQSPEESDSE
jgi:ribosome production factor 2